MELREVWVIRWEVISEDGGMQWEHEFILPLPVEVLDTATLRVWPERKTVEVVPVVVH